ncbi:hypothetical protein T02_3479 [Trichinella nativa]|uniref:Uncharacterized protein n=1 Tax=Trichinella nativa TaxID=6335 RepID=A0A0V1L147_9BILA|nr:hypothetical protein T02_3479 [Trichinella nativa]
MASRFSAFFNNEPVEFEINGRFSILLSEKLILNELHGNCCYDLKILPLFIDGSSTVPSIAK